LEQNHCKKCSLFLYSCGGTGNPVLGERNRKGIADNMGCDLYASRSPIQPPVSPNWGSNHTPIASKWGTEVVSEFGTKVACADAGPHQDEHCRYNPVPMFRYPSSHPIGPSRLPARPTIDFPKGH
jgi:hypothetical protein